MSNKVHIEIDFDLPGQNIVERDNFNNVIIDESFIKKLLSCSFYRTYEEMMTLIEDNKDNEIIRAKSCFSRHLHEADVEVSILRNVEKFDCDLDDIGYDYSKEY